MTDYKQIQNRWKPDVYLHIEHGKIEASQIAGLGWHSAQWEFMPVAGTAAVNIRNRWKSNTHLHIEHGKLEASSLGSPGWVSAQWIIVAVPNTNFVRLQNRWKPDIYLHIEHGKLEAGPIAGPGWQSAQWRTPSINRSAATNSDDFKSGAFTISKSKNDRSDKIKVIKEENIGNYICSETKVDAAKSIDINFVTEDSSNQAVYPGAMIYGQDMLNGKYNTIYAKRTPITISTDLPMTHSGQDPRMEVSSPEKIDNVRTALNKMINQQVRGQLHTSGGLKWESVHSEEQFDLAAKGRFSRTGLTVAGSFGMSLSENKNYMTATFLQKYFTVDVTRKNNAAAFFENRTEADSVINNNKTPLYISSVDYGRAAYFLIETSEKHEVVEATLSVDYDSLGVEASAELKAKFERLMQKSTMKVLVVGSSATSTVEIINGWEGFKRMVKSGAPLRQGEMPRPISYKMSYIEDGSIANINVTTSYTKRECRKATGEIEVTIKSLTVESTGSGENGDLELYENVDIHLMKNGREIQRKSVRFEDKDDYISIDQGDSRPFNRANTVRFKVKVGEEDIHSIRLESQIWDQDDWTSNDRMAGNKTIRVDKATIKDGSFTAGEGDKRIKINFSMLPVDD